MTSLSLKRVLLALVDLPGALGIAMKDCKPTGCSNSSLKVVSEACTEKIDENNNKKRSRGMGIRMDGFSFVTAHLTYSTNIH